MMSMDEIRQNIVNLTNSDDLVRFEAHRVLLAHDEAIIPMLIDEFYAGVNLQTGSALLEIMGQIGGYQVVGLFFELMNDSTVINQWRTIAEHWLRHDGMM